MSKKIALLTGEFLPRIGGIGTYVDNIACGAKSLGYDVTVVAPKYPEFNDAEHRIERPYRVSHIAMNTSPRGGIEIGTLQTALALASHLATNRYDILHFASDRTFEVAAILKRFMRFHYISTIHGTDVLKLSSSRRGKLLAPFAAGGADRILSLSHYARSTLLDRFETVDPATAVVAPPGVDPFWFEPEANLQGVREELGAGQDDLVMLAVARLEARKGHDLVIESLASLPQALRRRIIFVSVGPTIEAGFVDKIDRLATEKGVRFVRRGALSKVDVRRHYAAADFVCMPGRGSKTSVEGFGLVFLEAGAQAKPSIASQLGGMGEAVVNGKTGLVVTPDSIPALAQAISLLAGDATLRHTLGKQAQAFASEFTWRRCAEITYQGL